MSIEPHEMALLRKIIDSLEVRKTCQQCVNFSNGCALADGQMPPQEIQDKGCQKWEWSECPF